MTAEGGVGRMTIALIAGASRGMGLTVAQALDDRGPSGRFMNADGVAGW